MARFVVPDAVVLPLSQGDTLVVRRRLNYGEQSAMFARMSTLTGNGTREVDSLLVGIAKMGAYLLDWSLRDASGQPIVIRDLPVAVLETVLHNLDPDDAKEIRDAIEAHIDREDARRAEEKKTRAGGAASLTTSTSPAAAAGATSGS